jgi:hypothetical protein
MKTRTKTEFAVMGMNSDGTSRTLSKRFGNAADAQKHIGEYISYTERFPNDFKPFDEYRIVKRNVITTYEEWEEI